MTVLFRTAPGVYVMLALNGIVVLHGKTVVKPLPVGSTAVRLMATAVA